MVRHPYKKDPKRNPDGPNLENYPYNTLIETVIDPFNKLKGP